MIFEYYLIGLFIIAFGILIEYLVQRKRELNAYEFNDSITNLNCGFIERISYIFFSMAYFKIFQYVYEHWSFYTVETNFISITILILTVDFIWYWYHRAGHQVNVFWAAHVTHHQSEKFNFTVGLRVSSLQMMIRGLFWLPMAFLGFDPFVTISVIVFHSLYQFFNHTTLINKLGWIEEIFVTPSHHRVHHGKNEEYLDKNFGGIFILWDKLFGTFEREKNKVEFGITKKFNTANPFIAYFSGYKDLLSLIKQKSYSYVTTLKLVFSSPATTLEYYPNPKETSEVTLNSRQKKYVLINFSLYIIPGIVLLIFSSQFPIWFLIFLGVMFTYNTYVIGLLLSSAHKIAWLEYIRIVMVSASLFMLGIVWDFPVLKVISVVTIFIRIVVFAKIKWNSLAQ